MEWLQHLAAIMGAGAGLVSVGVAFGALPRLSKQLDEIRRSCERDSNALWRAIEESRNDRRSISERLRRIETICEQQHGD